MITEQQLNDITSRIARNFKPDKIILYGSYATGTQTEASDIDLLVVVKKATEPLFKRARIIRQHLWGIADTTKDILVYTQAEIDEWKEVAEAFVTTAIRTGKVIYEDKGGID